MLEFFEVKKYYGDRLVLSITNCRLDPGVYWLQGSNGSGKTTLLRMIAGLLPFKGDIQNGGHSLRRDPVNYRRSISWADAEPKYPAFLTGEDLLSFYLSIRKTPLAQAEQLLATFSMRPYVGTRIGGWSDGMIKKLSLVLAFLGSPSLIVLDEPLVTLDTSSVALLCKMIHDHRSNGGCCLLTSHQDIDRAYLVADKKLLIRDQSLETLEPV